MEHHAIRILLVEDNEGDILLALEALKEAKINNYVAIVRDGQEAIDFLKQVNGYENEPRPDLVLLDINLPKIDGQEVLEFIKKDTELRYIPVVMLTTSSAESDVLNAYYNYANCYITKPLDLENFFLIVQKIESFWLTIAQLPSKN